MWEQLLQKAILAQWGQLKGVRHQGRMSGGVGIEGPASVLGAQVISPFSLGSPLLLFSHGPPRPRVWRDVGQWQGGTCRDHKDQFSWAEQGDGLGLKGRGVIAKQV